MGAEVVTVSCDTKYVHLAWHRDEGMLKDVTYPMGSDPTGDIGRAFGIHDEEKGLHLRGTFIISPQGVLLNSEVNFFNLGRNVDELMRKFKANLHLAKKTAEACPAQWKVQGDKTLKPSAKMVGRVAEAMKD